MTQPQKSSLHLIYKPCKFWLSPSGHCKWGDHCRFIHDVRFNIYTTNGQTQVQTLLPVPLPLLKAQECKNNVAYIWKIELNS